jgi:hypothetical protein
LVPRRLLTERHAYRRQKQTPKQERASRHHYKYANYEFRTRRINPRDVACVPSESVRSFAVFAGSGRQRGGFQEVSGTTFTILSSRGRRSAPKDLATADRSHEGRIDVAD